MILLSWKIGRWYANKKMSNLFYPSANGLLTPLPTRCPTISKRTRSFTADAVLYRQPSGQPTNMVMLNLNWLRVEEVSWQWSVGRVTVPRRGKMWHDVTWRDVTWRDITWYDVTWGTSRGMTWHDVAWRGMTWHDVTWRDMTWHDMTWHNAAWRDMTRRDVTQHDVTWRAIRISTQQEWTLLHMRWLRYCRKTIKTFLGLKLFTGDA